MSPVPIVSLVLQRVELADALEIRNALIFDFYPGLPHMLNWQEMHLNGRQFTNLSLCFDLFVNVIATPMSAAIFLSSEAKNS